MHLPESKIQMFSNRLSKVYRHFSRQAKRGGITCYRLYDHDLPEFPFCIELYHDKVYVAEYNRRHGMTEEEHAGWLRKCLEIMASILSVSPENIFLKERRRKQGRQGQYRKISEKRTEIIVGENDLKFIVNLSNYLDTGLFLDHRLTRKMVKESASGKRILNLFAYTGSFSVYAASGGAEEVVTVDLSKTYLQWARRNMELNGFADESKYRYVQADARQYIKNIPPAYFDMIILDPPSFSNSKRMEGFLDLQRDHAGLINDCLEGLKKEGLLYFSTNYRQFVLEDKNIKAAAIKDITRATTSFDFEGKPARKCYLVRK